MVSSKSDVDWRFFNLKSEVFKSVEFDSKASHITEDIDFSTRVVACFGANLYIAPLAKLAHYHAKLNRINRSC